MTLRSGTRRLLALALCLPFSAYAQFTAQNDPANLAGERVSAPDLADNVPINHGALALQQLLRKLRTRASFMLIVAHPDDEDGGMLTYLSRGQGARVAMLTLTRGEGGQNLMSADFEDALGLIRTQELLAADRYMGVDQFFGTEVDFGFTKTKEEAFKKWTHERVLYDAVRAVRLYRPLVIGAVFIGEPSDGHGQHQVSGEIAQEVFKAAGDPNVFPDQIAAGLQPWQPLKVYARIPFARIDEQGMFDYATNQYVKPQFTNYVTGKVTTTVPKANVTIPEGTPDPLLGNLTYVQFARQGLGLQKSQIGHATRLARPGKFDVSYHRYGSRLNQPDGDDSGLESGFFDGVETSLPGIASLAPDIADTLRPGLQRLDNNLAKAQHDFDPAKPEAIAPILRNSLESLDKLIAELQNSAVNDLSHNETFNVLHELKVKRVQLNNALLLAEGITLTATTPAAATTGNVRSTDTTFKVNLELANHSDHKAAISNLSFDAAGTHIPTDEHRSVTGGSTWHGQRTLQSSGAFSPTRPYFARSDIEQPFYNVSDGALRSAPAAPAALIAHATIDCDGVPLYVDAVVSNEMRTHPVAFVPPVSVSVATGQDGTRTRVLPNYEQSFTAALTKRPADAPTQNEALVPTDGWRAKPSSSGFSGSGELMFQVAAPAAGRVAGTLTGSVQTADGHTYNEGYRPVGYAGIPTTNYYTPATLRVIPIDVRTAPNLNIGFIPGTGDDTPIALEQLGIKPHILTDGTLTAEALKPYDAVILGVRAYEHSDLAAANPALDAYAAAGGVVIVQYNTGKLPDSTGPYPLNLGDSEKVVEEDAPVTLLDPTNPLLTWPNKITSGDFNGWVEERGHGFMGTWDPHYTALTEVHDEGQKPQRGGLLVARCGHGAWIYLAYALYRQFPEGVPGSYRILANLISAGRNPHLD